MLCAGGAEFSICDEDLTNDVIVAQAQELAKLPELQSLTFEHNTIRDEEALGALFTNLRGYDRLENLNVRENKFSYNIVNALALGIEGKKELRVSYGHYSFSCELACLKPTLICSFRATRCRLLIWAKT